MTDNTSKYNFVDLTVALCFKNFFIVPDYQREFVWESRREVERLLSDVIEAYNTDPNKEYFIGTTVVYNNNGRYELIDGQQRTTTLFLILCAFRNLFAKRSIPHNVIDSLICDYTYGPDKKQILLFHLELQYEEATNLLTDIAEEKDKHKSILSPSGKRLVEAYEYIYNQLASLEEHDLNNLLVYILYKLKFIQISTQDINDALKIFETINDRGTGLNPMDLLKNLIFRQVNREQFAEIKSLWKQLVSILEEANEKPLRFLRYFIMSNYPAVKHHGIQAKDTNILREDEIYNWMSNKDNRLLTKFDKKPAAFVDILIENAKAFVNFSRGLDVHGTQNVYLTNIIAIGGNSFRQHIILLLCARKYNPEMFNLLAKNIENYLFVSLVSREQAKVFEKAFAEWCIALKGVKSKEDLIDFVKDYMTPAVDKKRVEFKDRFRSLSQNDIQMCRLRYILARISQYVDNTYNGVKSLTTIDNYAPNGIEIEHILPKTCPSEEIRSSFEDYDRAVSMLGNLTILGQPMNSSVKNKPYSEKVIEYGKSSFVLTRSLSKKEDVGKNTAINKLNEHLISFSEWTDETIIQRQEMLLELSRIIWRMEGQECLFESDIPVDNENDFINHLSIVFPDGETIDHPAAAETFVEAIKKIGPAKVYSTGIKCCGVLICGKSRDAKYGKRQIEIGEGWLVMTNSNTIQKAAYIRRIAKYLKLDIQPILTKIPKQKD